MRRTFIAAALGLWGSYSVAMGAGCADVGYYSEFKDGDVTYKYVYRVEDCQRFIEEHYVNDVKRDDLTVVYPIDGKFHETLRSETAEEIRIDTKRFAWDRSGRRLIHEWRIRENAPNQPVHHYSDYYTVIRRRGSDVVLRQKNKSGVKTEEGWEITESTQISRYDALNH